MEYRTTIEFILLTTLYILAIFTFLISNKLIAQNQDAKDYDFWVGEWTVTWKNQDGTSSTATNRIEKTLDGKVFQEHFNDPSSGFKGTSLSVFNPKRQHLASSLGRQPRRIL